MSFLKLFPFLFSTVVIFIHLQAVGAAEMGLGLDTFWSEGQSKKGANFFNHKEDAERIKAAKRLGLSWIRLTPSKWKSSIPNSKLGDFLIGSKGAYKGLIKKDLDYLKEVLTLAGNENLKVVLTFLNVPNLRWKQHDNGVQERKIWESLEAQEASLNFFADLAVSLKNQRALVGINPLNEPSPELTKTLLKDWRQDDYVKWYEKIEGSSQDLNLYYEKLVRKIRQQNSKVSIILDSGYYATPWAFKILKPIEDPNVLYSFHFYEPYLYTFQKGNYSYPGKIPIGETGQIVEKWDRDQIKIFLEPVKDWQKKYNIPSTKVMVGEFGLFRDAPGAAKFLEDSLEVFEENHWHWAFYSFREDEWPRMDYELGASKKANWDYWKAIEKGLVPSYDKVKDHSLINIIKKYLKPFQSLL